MRKSEVVLQVFPLRQVHPCFFFLYFVFTQLTKAFTGDLMSRAVRLRENTDWSWMHTRCIIYLRRYNKSLICLHYFDLHHDQRAVYLCNWSWHIIEMMCPACYSIWNLRQGVSHTTVLLPQRVVGPVQFAGTWLVSNHLPVLRLLKGDIKRIF